MNTDPNCPPSDDTHRIFFEHNPLPMYLHDVENMRILEVNDAAIAHYGYSREEFLSLSLLDIRPKEEHERLVKVVRDPWSGLSDAGVWIHRKKSGELLHALIHFGQFERNGRQVRLIVVHDITERVTMEKKLRDSESSNRMLIEQSIDGIFVTDNANRYVDVNGVGCRMLGYSFDEILKLTIYDVVQNFEKHRVEPEVSRTMQGGTTVSQWSFRRKDGSEFLGEVRARKMEDGRVLGILRDITAQKAAENALRTSEERFRIVVSNVPDFIIMFDREGRLTFINRIFPGYKMEEVIGSSSYNFMDPAYHDIHREALRVVFEEGQSYSYEVQARGTPGEWRWYLNRITPLKENSVTIAAIQIATDITERRRSEEALRESEARFRAVVESVPGSILLLDRELCIRFINAALPGLSRDDAVGRPATEFVIEKFRDAYRNLVLRTIDAGESGALELMTQSGATEGRWVEMRTTPLVKSGSETQALVIAIDIDGRKRAEAQLRESRDFIERFARTAPYVIYVFDIEKQQTVWVNRLFTDDLGYPKELAESWGDSALPKLLHPEDILQMPGWIARWPKTPDGVVLQTEYRLKHSNGSWRNFLGRDVVFMRNAAGGVKQIIGSVEDITERKQLEDQLRQSQKLDSIGRLAGGIAHDFNNLLTSILGHLELAEGHLPADSRALADLEVIRIAAERSAELTSQLLSFARKQITQPRLVNLNELMQETQRLLLRVIGENIEMHAVPFPNLGLAKIDPGQLTQVLINLAVNARDAMPGGGKLLIETGHATIIARDATDELIAGEYITLAVTDTGTGMSPEVLRHIFEPFFTTKDIGRGTGLGLATCYGIIKQALGHIVVKTEVGMGSTFTIYLPRADGTNSQLPAIPQLANASGTETILVVEDDEMLRSLATRFLSAQGYTVIAAANGPKALDLVKTDPRKISLLLSDVVMPGMSGTKLAGELCLARPGLRVLFMTGYTEEDMSGFDTALGATGVLNKPFSLPVLGKTIRELLDRKI